MTMEGIWEVVKTCFIIREMKFSRRQDPLRAWVNAQT